MCSNCLNHRTGLGYPENVSNFGAAKCFVRVKKIKTKMEKLKMSSGKFCENGKWMHLH